MAGVDLKIAGKNSPTLKLLNRLVKKSVSSKWYDLGIELLDDDDCGKLDEIQSNNPKDKQPSASWNQLIQALRQPSIELDGLANEIEQKLKSISEGLLSTQSAKSTCSQAVALPPKYIPAVLTFSPEEDIDYAFSRLSSGIKTMIENSGCKFNILQDACLEKALSPKACISGEIVPKIEEVNSFQTLCTTLTKAQHWNFLDTRMMEAMVTASMIPTAHETLQNFKKTFYGMKLSEIVPAYVPVISLKKFSHLLIEEQLDVDPRQYTISELHKHRFYLETELLQSGSGTLTCYKIMVGSLFIVWRIDVDHAYNAHLTLSKKRSHLKSQAISHLSIPGVVKWESLPVVLRGQEVKEIGPIEQPLKDRTREDLFPLPKGHKWTWLNSENAKQFKNATKDFQWICSHPSYKSSYIAGFFSGNTIAIALYAPQLISFGGIVLPVMFFSYELSGCKGDLVSRMMSELLKEITRVSKQDGISELVFPNREPCIIKPIVVFTVWHYYFSYNETYHYPALPYDTPKTPGLRKMVFKDVPKALILTNQHASQFEIHHVFQSEEEFSHYFLCPSVPSYVTTYVVEDPTNGNITDLFSFNSYTMDGKAVARVGAIIITNAPERQFVTDLLVCTKKENVDRLHTIQHGLAKSTFECLFKSFHFLYFHMYNYGYPETDEGRCCLFSI
ncbi:uncharacterized protein [Dysidea avara]|uniref:uncharacterized protein isoform X2 n=1 Tax=Dysidea avara TaxID=196820 RepID=UPI0033321172